MTRTDPELHEIFLDAKRYGLTPPEATGVRPAYVRDIRDPTKRGRVRVQIWGKHTDNVELTSLPWALPCMPGGGSPDVASFFTLPVVGSTVWVMFVHADHRFPVWIGGWWSAPKGVPTLPSEVTDVQYTDTPPEQPVVQLLKTRSGHKITLRETTADQDIEIETAGGRKLTLRDGPGNKGAVIEVAGMKINISEGNKIEIDAGSLPVDITASNVNLGGDDLSLPAIPGPTNYGCVRGKDVCAFTGAFHPAASGSVKAKD